MAEIITTKELVTVGQKPEERMALGVGPGHVKILVEHDLVAHEVVMSPQEAVQMGVSLIQLAGQAQAMGEMERVQANGAIGLPPNFKPMKG